MVLSECIVAVNEALVALERLEGELWSLPLVAALESQSEGKALDWSCAVMLEALHNSESGTIGRQEWLAELLVRKRSWGAPADLMRRAREIWYHGDGRDDVQVAVARLYEGLASLRSNDVSAYRKCVAMAVGIVTITKTVEDRQVQRTIELFREHCEELHGLKGE